MDLNELRLEKGRLVTQMRAINDKATAEKRAYTEDETTKYAAMELDLDRIVASIEREEKLIKAATDPAPRAGIRALLDGNKRDKDGKPIMVNSTAEYRMAFERYLQGGERNTPLEITATLTKGTGTQVGYLVATEYETTIRKAVYPLNIMRRLATVITSSTDSVIPLEGALPTFGWIDELGAYPKTDLTVGRAGYSAYKLGGIILASEEILADAFVDLPAYIADRSKVSIAATEEAAFTIGDGNKKPTGVVPSATLGLTTASATAIAPDEVLDFMDSLPIGYHPNAQLLATVAWRSKIRKLKTTTGEYIWQPGLQAGVPDTLNGKTLNISAYMATPAANAIVALFGDFSYYTIVDRLGLYLRQLNELYAETGQVGFQLHERVDGKLLIPAAIVSMKMGAS